MRWCEGVDFRQVVCVTLFHSQQHLNWVPFLGQILNGRAQHRLFSQKHLRDLFTLDVDEPAEGEGATVRVSTRRQDIHRQASRTQEQNLQRVLRDRADTSGHRGPHLGSDSGSEEEEGEAELTTLALAKQLEKPAAVTETQGLFEGVSIREAAGAISKRERQQRELRKRQKTQAGKRRSQSSAYLLGSDASSDSSSGEDDRSRGIGDLSRPSGGARAASATSSADAADSSRAAESLEEKSLVKALLSSDDIRGTFNHDKAEGTVDVAAAHVTAQEASRIATQALAQLQRSRVRVQARPVHQPTWTGLMGSSGRGGRAVGGENGARSLLDQIKRRKASLRGADQATAGGSNSGAQSFRGLGVAKSAAPPTSSSSLAASASSTVKSRVDVAEDLLRRMTHWFRRRNGVAPTRDVLRAFRNDGDNGDITPNIFKGLLLSICAFKRGYWILNEDEPHDQTPTGGNE